MKKTYLLLITLLMTISAMADSVVKSGDVNILRDANSEFSIEYDFSNTLVEDVPYNDYLASRDADWNRDWPNDRAAGTEYFIKKWNKKNKKGMKASQQSDCRYRLVIKPTYIHFGSSALAWTIGFGAGGMKMSGTMELYDGADRVLVIEVTDQTGKSYMKERNRFCSLMEELADDTYKDIF